MTPDERADYERELLKWEGWRSIADAIVTGPETDHAEPDTTEAPVDGRGDRPVHPERTELRIGPVDAV